MRSLEAYFAPMAAIRAHQSPYANEKATEKASARREKAPTPCPPPCAHNTKTRKKNININA